MKLKLRKLLPYLNSLLILLSILIILSVIIFIYRGYRRTLNTLFSLQYTSFEAVSVGPDGKQTIDKDIINEALDALTAVGSLEQQKKILSIKSEIKLSIIRCGSADNPDVMNELSRKIMNRMNWLMLDYVRILRERLHSLGILGLFALIAFLVYFFSTMKTLARRFQERYSEQISMRSRELLQSIRQRERDRLAMVLHDHVLQNMAALSMQPELNSSPDLKGAFRDINNNLRTIIQGFHPEHLAQCGLEASLSNFINCFCSPDTKFQLKVDLKEEITQDLLSVYSILQELLLNISEHAHADNASVNLIAVDSSLEIGIIDDGKGFDLDPKVKDYTLIGPTLGLIQHQVEYVDGIFSIRSAPGKGCSVYILYPLNGE
jgi:signal transduction histidine kinase